MYWRVLKHVVKRPAFSNLRFWCQGRDFTTEPLKKKSKSLRILFCGSDDFSCASLRALYDEHKRSPQLIASIDVLCRPGKPSGRDLKQIREVPIKAVAQELDLPIHERDTFTGWDLPNPYNEPINIIIAVSFGLFVPPRILKSVEYGGLNVHPSLLPNFRGPAPLHHTIMSGAKSTGVTLQTLDEKSFDNGIILAQTPRNGLPLPFDSKCTYEQLLNYLKPVAATMLVQGLRDRVFVPPHIDVGWWKAQKKLPVHAKKITTADKWINWREHSAHTIERQFRALGRLWSLIYLDTETKKRIVFEDMEFVPMPESIANWLSRFQHKRHGPMKPTHRDKEVIHFMVVEDNGYKKPRFYVVHGDAIIVACQNGALRIKKITLEGKGKQDAATVMKGFKDWEDWKCRKTNGYVNVLSKDVDMSKVQWKTEESTGDEGPGQGEDARKPVGEGVEEKAE